MPPKVRFDREKIISAAFEIVREKGMEALCARAIAKAAGCSTQPLYHEMGGMEEIKEAVMKRAGQYFEQFVEEQARAGADATFEFAAGLVAQNLGYSMEDAREFHRQSHVFIHGLAAMLTTGFIAWDEEEIIRLLRHQYRALRLAFETPAEKN